MLPDSIKVTGPQTSIEPPESWTLPACKRCFEVPTRLLLIETDLPSRMKARVLGIDLPKYVIRLRPCDHFTEVPKGELKKTVCDMTGADPEKF